jgi:hypothetical protein
MEKKAIMVTDEVTGDEIVEYFKSNGVNVAKCNGNASVGLYYGVEYGELGVFYRSYIEYKGFEVIELPKKEEKKHNYYLYDIYLGEEVVVRGLKAGKVRIDDRLSFYLEDKVVASFTSSYSYVLRENGNGLNSGLADGDSAINTTSFCTNDGCIKGKIVGYIINGEPFFG